MIRNDCIYINDFNSKKPSCKCLKELYCDKENCRFYLTKEEYLERQAKILKYYDEHKEKRKNYDMYYENEKRSN